MSALLDTSKSDKYKEKAFIRSEREVNDLKKILSIPEGRRFVWGLLADCKIFENSFTGNSTGIFLQGRQSVGQQLLQDINKADKFAFSKMQLEFYSELNKDKKETV